LRLQVERLAAGLRHEPAFAAAAIDVSPAAAAQFASAMLGVSSVPAVLLYPEAARGSLKFLGKDTRTTMIFSLASCDDQHKLFS
jgi:hypothetical protein